MFENGNYRRRKRRPKQILPNIAKPSSTSSSIPLDESSLSSSESNHQSLLISSNHDEDDLVVHPTQYDRYSFIKNEPRINATETKKRQRSSTPELEHQQTKKSKTVSAFSSIDALIAPSKEIKSSSSDLSVSPCRYNQANQNINNTNSHPSYLSSLPPQYLSLLTNGFPLHPSYNRPYPNK